jgi:hypothetical protein
MDPEELISKQINEDDILSKDDLYTQILLEKEKQILWEQLSLDFFIKENELNIY